MVHVPPLLLSPCGRLRLAPLCPVPNIPLPVVDGKLRELEGLSIWSDHIDKLSKETTDKKGTTDTAAAELVVCPLVAAMLAVEATEATTIEKEKNRSTRHSMHVFASAFS